ncbi:TetR/AcrR family transcriptional regulator [Corynebacterium choanae]|uniref:HTH tetR-type domain-containing protein n=1 Tax=Corynebacterium choanae TaxID=1862358 RepID=A0A3G6J5H4_9CORY|nr:hypothetical protein [Corynebacterium choanae]AZA13122.1 hypothetical protein CCHOA_03555 [Corynebacterium choanae]
MPDTFDTPHPGPRKRFTLEDVIQEAFALGLDQFSISGVARNLGVRAPSIYRVVESHEHLAYLCVERAVASMPLPDAALPWSAQLSQFAEHFWTMCDRHSGLAQALITVPTTHLAVRHYFEQLLTQLAAVADDVPLPRFQFAVDLISKITVMGSVVTEGLKKSGESETPGGTRIDDSYLLKLFPHLSPANGYALVKEEVEFVISGLADTVFPRHLSEQGLANSQAITAAQSSQGSSGS